MFVPISRCPRWPQGLRRSRFLVGGPLGILIALMNAVSAAQFANFTYTDNGTSITITDYPSDAPGSYIAIPATINSKPVKSIGNGAFSYCTQIVSMSIPSSVTSISNGVFANCSELTSITVDPDNPNYASENGVLFNKPKTTLIQCPAGKSGVYKIPAGVSVVGYGGFSGCDELTRITIPSGVTHIAESAFLNCSKMTSVTLPASITSIERYAFSQSYKLTGVYFMGNAPATGTIVFSGLGAGFKIYYFNSRSGFTSPTWMGYPSVAMGDETPVKAWLISHNLPHDSNLQSDPNGDGVSSLMAYALNLDPNQNLNGCMPRPVVTESQMSLEFFAGAAGVTDLVETSTDLKNWRADEVTISGTDADEFRAATVNRSGSNR